QPFISKLSLPSGKMHYDDISLHDAMLRELSYFMDTPPKKVSYRGVMEYRAFIDKVLVTHTIAHVFSGSVPDNQVDGTRLFWADITQAKKTAMSPGTSETVLANEQHQGIFF